MEFILILSPRRAPPVFRLDGSQETIAILTSLRSIRILIINSSVKEDFPAPPVPVRPITGTSFLSASFEISDEIFANTSLLSALASWTAEIKFAVIYLFSIFNCS